MRIPKKYSRRRENKWLGLLRENGTQNIQLSQFLSINMRNDIDISKVVDLVNNQHHSFLEIARILNCSFICIESRYLSSGNYSARGFCRCGCGCEVALGRAYINHHSSKGQKHPNAGYNFRAKLGNFKGRNNPNYKPSIHVRTECLCGCGQLANERRIYIKGHDHIGKEGMHLFGIDNPNYGNHALAGSNNPSYHNKKMARKKSLLMRAKLSSGDYAISPLTGHGVKVYFGD